MHGKTAILISLDVGLPSYTSQKLHTESVQKNCIHCGRFTVNNDCCAKHGCIHTRIGASMAKRADKPTGEFDDASSMITRRVEKLG